MDSHIDKDAHLIKPDDVGYADALWEGPDVFISLGKGACRAGKLGNYFSDEGTGSTSQRIYSNAGFIYTIQYYPLSILME